MISASFYCPMIRAQVQLQLLTNTSKEQAVVCVRPVGRDTDSWTCARQAKAAGSSREQGRNEILLRQFIASGLDRDKVFP